MAIVQIASPQNAIIAKCNVALIKKQYNSLFLKDLIHVKLLARPLLHYLSKNRGDTAMSSALILLNAIALAVVVAFHFQPGSSVDPLASVPAHYSHYQSPQRVVMSDRAAESARIASLIQVEQPVRQQSETWVF